MSMSARPHRNSGRQRKGSEGLGIGFRACHMARRRRSSGSVPGVAAAAAAAAAATGGQVASSAGAMSDTWKSTAEVGMSPGCSSGGPAGAPARARALSQTICTPTMSQAR